MVAEDCLPLRASGRPRVIAARVIDRARQAGTRPRAGKGSSR